MGGWWDGWRRGGGIKVSRHTLHFINQTYLKLGAKFSFPEWVGGGMGGWSELNFIAKLSSSGAVAWQSGAFDKGSFDPIAICFD